MFLLPIQNLSKDFKYLIKVIKVPYLVQKFKVYRRNYFKSFDNISNGNIQPFVKYPFNLL